MKELYAPECRNKDLMKTVVRWFRAAQRAGSSKAPPPPWADFPLLDVPAAPAAPDVAPEFVSDVLSSKFAAAAAAFAGGGGEDAVKEHLGDVNHLEKAAPEGATCDGRRGTVKRSKNFPAWPC